MAPVSDLVAVGIQAQWAKALGFTVNAAVAAAGTTISDATTVTDTIINVTSTSGANAGVKIPLQDASNTKAHLILNVSGSQLYAYITSPDTIVTSCGLTLPGPTFVVVPYQSWALLFKIGAGTWGAVGN